MIPRTELAEGYSISRLIHGGWQFSAGHRLGGPALDDALEVLVRSAELGVTTFDCADIYTGVEELYGRFLQRWKSTSTATPLQLHTKFVPDAEVLPEIDRRYVRSVVERSLRRLGVERVDLVQYYWWRDDVPGMEETALWLTELQQEGKIRHVGVTNFDAERVERLRAAGVPVVANQVQYSLLDRRPEHGLAEYARAHGVGLLCFGTVAGGYLTDRWSGAADERPRSRSQVKYRLVIDEFGGWERFQELMREVDAAARAAGCTIPAFALRWVLDRPAVTAVVVGATRLGQIERNLEAFAAAPDPELAARIDRLLTAAPGPAGDVFELERDRDGPHGRIMRYDLNRTGDEDGDRA